MPSALLLAAIQLLKMNAKLTAALPPLCFLLHLIARFKVHPESLGKQRISPLQKLQQGLFFLCLFTTAVTASPWCSQGLDFPAGRSLARAGWAETPAGFCYDSACSFWSQARLFGAGHLLSLVSMHLPHLQNLPSLPRPVLQSGSSCSLWASFSPWNPPLSTSSSFWKPSLQLLQPR